MLNERALSAIEEVSENKESGLGSENESESEGEDESGLTTGENDGGGYNTWSDEDSNAGSDEDSNAGSDEDSENSDPEAAANSTIPIATAVGNDYPQLPNATPITYATLISTPLLPSSMEHRAHASEGSCCCLIGFFGTLALIIYGINYLVNNNDKPGSGGAYTGIVMHPPADHAHPGELVFQSKGNPPPYQTLEMVNAAMHPCTIKLNALAENNKVTWNLNLLNDKISFTWGQYADTKIGFWPKECNLTQFGNEALADVKINNAWVVPMSIARTPEPAINNLRGSREPRQFPSLFGLDNTTDKGDSTQNAQDSSPNSSPKISIH